MAYPIVSTLVFTAGSATAVAASQAVAGAGALTLNGSVVSGGVATFDAPRRVAVVSSSAGDSTQSVTITGTDRNKTPNTISETLALSGTTIVYTQQDFATVTRVTVSAALAGNITVGTTTTGVIGSSQWFVDNPHDNPFQLSTFCRLVTGAATYTVEYTPDDPNDAAGGYTVYPVFDTIEFNSNVPPVAWPDPLVNGLTQASAFTVLNGPVFAHRYTINAGTGTVMFQSIQSGIHQ